MGVVGFVGIGMLVIGRYEEVMLWKSSDNIEIGGANRAISPVPGVRSNVMSLLECSERNSDSMEIGGANRAISPVPVVRSNVMLGASR